ncbi:MAG: formate dehydrogenase accessory sulfurtransferase FdhD [Planctomycetes bacterium]|nr:formate dehydrogenase accessory sulfurtransferase FdhD [Planctomycetota bacterium]
MEPPPPTDLPGVRRLPCEAGEQALVREEPLVIEVCTAVASGADHVDSVLTMRTPGHDEELALGFLLSEGVLRAPADVATIEAVPRAAAGSPYPVDVVRVSVRPGGAPGPLERDRLTRAHAVRASCGLCGRASPAGLTSGLAPLAAGAPCVTVERLAALAEVMRAGQPVFHATGGSHAAGVFDAETGEPWAVREDVGRHNALDKALGRCARDGRDLARAAVVLSGRGGFELVLKALRLGVPIVGSVSAPSSLSVELALERGLTLVGFLRGGTGTVYSDDGRLVGLSGG